MYWKNQDKWLNFIHFSVGTIYLCDVSIFNRFPFLLCFAPGFLTDTWESLPNTGPKDFIPKIYFLKLAK